MEIKKIVPPTVDLYSPEDVFLGSVNEYEFTEFRTQIHANHAKGYYILVGNEKYIIDSNGKLPRWPDGVFTELMEFFSMLCK